MILTTVQNTNPLLNLDASSIIALAALFVSVVNALIQGVLTYRTHISDHRHAMKMRTLDLEYQHKHQAYEGFIKAVSLHKNHQTYLEKQAVTKALHSAILVCNPETLVLLKKFGQLHYSDSKVDENLLLDIVVSFNRELTKVSAAL